MDNTYFHHSDQIKQVHYARVKVLYLPSYSPDFNLIEEFFAGSVGYIRKPGQCMRKIPIKGCMLSFGSVFMIFLQNRRVLKAISNIKPTIEKT